MTDSIDETYESAKEPTVKPTEPSESAKEDCYCRAVTFGYESCRGVTCHYYDYHDDFIHLGELSEHTQNGGNQ